METPSTTSGDLRRSDFPSPSDLGAGWAYAVDDGDAEEGYAGNGTPALARDPREVALAAVPMGCPRPAALPLPQHALEVDYTVRGDPVIAVRASFRNPAAARGFFGARAEAVTGCAGLDGGTGLGPLVGPVRTSRRAVVSVRTPRSDPWTELALLDGTDVVLVALGIAPGRPAPRPRALSFLAAAFGR